MHGTIFSDTNFKLIGISIVLLLVGYILLAQGPVYNVLSWTISPLILVGVYCVLLPIAIIYKEKKKPDDKNKKGV